MDNSLLLYKQKVEQMIGELELFSSQLNHHVIIEPLKTIEEAVRYGLPSDKANLYLRKYYSKHISIAEDVMHYINEDCIPYLKDVAFYIESAMNEGGGYSSSTMSNPSPRNRIGDPAINKNNSELADALGVVLGAPMSIAEADKQSANPNYTPKYLEDSNGDFYYYNGEYRRIKWWMNLPVTKTTLDNMPRFRKNPDYEEKFSINCATTSAAYVLRKRGFPIWAKGNPKVEGNLNTWLSDSHSFDIWKNTDGSDAQPSLYEEWMGERGMNSMTPDDYRFFFEEKCKEKGVYIVTTAWKNGGGHATILERDIDGKLYFIEPQVFEADRTDVDGRRNIEDLISRMHPRQRWLGLGVMRVDDKIFDIKYADLFETNKI